MESLEAALRGSLGIAKIHQVAIVVRGLVGSLGLYRDSLGLELEKVMPIPSDHVRIGFVLVGEVKIELVQPTDGTTGVSRFLESKGEGFHHICFEVPDIQAALDRLASDGLQLIDTSPRMGADGPVAFVHPKSCHGVLVELVEAPGGPAWSRLAEG